jgi:hypothetical protein
VVVVGMSEEITNPSEIRRVEKLGLEHWAPGPKPHWMRIRAWDGDRAADRGEERSRSDRPGIEPAAAG